ncbi:MAG: gamma-glutamylcyclotransferase, partial [Azoarcus sp.]|nr:gamma-glutamylcyclotransferase [Azoarcus sp.]
MTSHNCFAYGSLMYEPIMATVSAQKCAGIPATLEGYSRHALQGEDYPGMVAEAGGKIAGILYRGLPATAIARLDDFEGAQYLRTQVIVRTGDGSAIHAEAYVLRPEYAHLLLPGDWDYAHFLAEGRQRFQR